MTPARFSELLLCGRILFNIDVVVGVKGLNGLTRLTYVEIGLNLGGVRITENICF